MKTDDLYFVVTPLEYDNIWIGHVLCLQVTTSFIHLWYWGRTSFKYYFNNLNMN